MSDGPPAISAMSKQALLRLPLAVLRLHLDQYHLQHGGTKQAVVNCLHARLQATELGLPSSDTDAQSQSSQSDGSVSDNSSTDPATEDDEDRDSDPASRQPPTPFTPAQQTALTTAITSYMSGTGRSRRKHSTTLTPVPVAKSNKRHRQKRKSHHRRKHHKRSSPTSSFSGSSSSESDSESDTSSTSDDDQSPRRKSRKHSHRHRTSKYHHSGKSTIPIPRSMAKKIMRGEFIDLSSLLSKHLTRTGALPRGRASKRARPNLIHNLDTWLEAWSVFAGVLTAHKPQLAPDLFSYQAFISRSSRKFHSYAWLQYDAQFRLKLASTKSMQWSVADPELIATWLSADATQKKSLCFTCGSPEHLAGDCPQKVQAPNLGLRCPVCNSNTHVARDCPQLPTTFRGVTRQTTETCRLFNKKGSCFRGIKCPYLHQCSACGGSHPHASCTNPPGPRPPNPPPTR